MTNKYELGAEINLLEEFSTEELHAMFGKKLTSMIGKEHFPSNYKIIKRNEDTVEILSQDKLDVRISFNTENRK